MHLRQALLKYIFATVNIEKLRKKSKHLPQNEIPVICNQLQHVCPSGTRLGKTTPPGHHPCLPAPIAQPQCGPAPLPPHCACTPSSLYLRLTFQRFFNSIALCCTSKPPIRPTDLSNRWSPFLPIAPCTCLPAADFADSLSCSLFANFLPIFLCACDERAKHLRKETGIGSASARKGRGKRGGQLRVGGSENSRGVATRRAHTSRARLPPRWARLGPALRPGPQTTGWTCCRRRRCPGSGCWGLQSRAGM